jgi:arginine-tRNA-protein transferase
LINKGFRRSGDDVYRPHCQACSDCVATRIPVGQFRPNRSQRRNWQQNQDLEVTIAREGFKPEYAELYRRYIGQRHADGGMDADSSETFAGFLLTQWCNTFMLEFRAKGELLAVATMDELASGLSLVYTFFDPEEGQRRGLGIFAVLWQIGYARECGFPFVYPGYWIKDCRKMSYKTQYQPIEGLVDGVWVRLGSC